MTGRKVTVVLMPNEDGGYSAFIPLFPNATTGGNTVEEALKNAKEALELVLKDATDVDMEALEYAYSPLVVIGEVELEMPDRVKLNVNNG